MPLRSIAFLLYFIGSSAGALAVPMLGVVCYIVLYHIFPQTTWWGVHLDFLGIRYSFVCGLCLLIGTTLNLNRQPLGRTFVHPLEWALLGMLMIFVLSTMTGTPWDYQTARVLDKMAKVFLFTFMMSHVVTTRHRLWVFTLTLTVMSLYLGHEAKIAPIGSFIRNRLDGIGGPDFRESSSLAVHLFAMLPFLAVVMRQPSLKWRVLAFLAACYSINAILLCQTRSAFVGGITAGILAVWYVPRRHRRWVVIMLILATIGGVILSDASFRDRMLTIATSAEERDASSQSRIEIWTVAWAMVKQNPWGVGIGHFMQEIGEYAEDPKLIYRDAHNSYVLCIGELGFVGRFAFLGILGLAWGTLSHANRRAKRGLADPDLFELIIFANRLSLVVFIVSSLFVSRLYTEGFWWLIMLPVCISRAVENEIRVEAREDVALAHQVKELYRQGDLPEIVFHS